MEIAKENPKALPDVIKLAQNTEDREILGQAIASLRETAKESAEAQVALTRILESTEYDYTSRTNLVSLDEIANYDMNALLCLVKTGKDDFTRRRATAKLGLIAKDKPQVRDDLIRLMQTDEDNSIRWQAANSLIEIDNNNIKAIATLISLVENAEDNSTLWLSVVSLGKISSCGNLTVISVLMRLLETADYYIRRVAARSIAQIASKGNLEAITALIKLIETSEDKFTTLEVVYSFTKHIQGNGLELAVSDLKSGLLAQTKIKCFWRYTACYAITWHCAQNITYPTFYQAWHQGEAVRNIINQMINQANLADILQKAISTHPQLHETIHLICIDTSQIIDINKPTPEIYDQMLDSGCPESEKIPETTAALKLYYNSLKRKNDKRLALVFYESQQIKQKLSDSFLGDISKFNGAICAISDEPKENLPLKFFTQNQSVEAFLTWLHNS